MLEREYDYYEKNISELATKYLGKWVVIVEDSVIGAFPSQGEAYANAVKTNKPGTFLIQEITGSTNSAIQRFFSLVYV